MKVLRCPVCKKKLSAKEHAKALGLLKAREVHKIHEIDILNKQLPKADVKAKEARIKAIESEWISNYGVYVENAEKKLKDILNIKYCILMNSGTAATHCLFLSVKYKYPI